MFPAPRDEQNDDQEFGLPCRDLRSARAAALRHLRMVDEGATDQAASEFSVARLDKILAELEELRICANGAPVGGTGGPVAASGAPLGPDFDASAGTCLGSTSDDDLCAAVLVLERSRRCLDALSTLLLGELDARDATNEIHGMRTGPWLAREAGLPSAGARSQVNVASKLRAQLSAAKSALDEGRIGSHHAKVLADAANPRIIDEFNRFIPELVELLPPMSFETWKRKVKEVADLLDEDGGHKPGDDITDNTLTLSHSWHGVLGLNGQLCGDGAVTVSHALEERADEIFHRMKRDSELTGDLSVPPRKTLMALALVELVREALGKQKGTTSAPRSEVSLVINAADPDVVTDHHGTPIGDTGRFSLLCDPIFKPVVMSVEGTVLDLGRDQRLASKALHDALAHRDGGCVWPGCENPSSWCDAHHSEHWRHGGTTDRENLAHLCRYHHGVTHRKGWAMHKTKDQWFWWQSPSGDTFWSQRHGIRRTEPPPPAVHDSGREPPPRTG